MFSKGKTAACTISF